MLPTQEMDGYGSVGDVPPDFIRYLLNSMGGGSSLGGGLPIFGVQPPRISQQPRMVNPINLQLNNGHLYSAELQANSVGGNANLLRPNDSGPSRVLDVSGLSPEEMSIRLASLNRASDSISPTPYFSGLAPGVPHSIPGYDNLPLLETLGQPAAPGTRRPPSPYQAILLTDHLSDYEDEEEDYNDRGNDDDDDDDDEEDEEEICG